MSATSGCEYVGAIAFYPTETYCAIASIEGENFVDIVDWTANPLFANTPDTAFTAAISYLDEQRDKLAKKFQLAKEIKFSGLAVSLYGVVKGTKCIQSTQENWNTKFDVWEKLITCAGEHLTDKDRLICHTDAATAAIAEYIWGAGKKIREAGDRTSSPSDRVNGGHHNLAYFKILDGVGSGVILAGRSWEGAIHPEMGHIPIRREKADSFRGICASHDDCVEGLASRAAMIARLASYKDLQSLKSLDDDEDHEIWKLEAYYLAELALIAELVVSPQKIIFEGEVIREHLIKKIRSSFRENLHGYPSRDLMGDGNVDDLIVAGEFLGPEASLLGALELARRQAGLVRAERSSEKSNKISRIVGFNPPFGQGPTGSKFEDTIKIMRRRRSTDQKKTQARRDITTALRRREKKWIFGLSLTEKIEWALASATEGKIDDGSIKLGVLCKDLPQGLMPIDGQDPIYLQTVLRDALLRRYKEKSPIFFDEDGNPRKFEGLGVSTIGVVKPDRLLLESIARKPWYPLTKDGAIVDFGALFQVRGQDEEYLFPCSLDDDRVMVQNDAPARCLTEYLYGYDEGDRPESLLYLMVGEGINGAAVFEGDLPHMLRHPEMGHCSPVLFEADRPDELAKVTGCPAHTLCFEGVTSNARFRREFGWDIWGLPEDHIAWDIAAHYLSQFAMMGALNFSPAKIVFGGTVVNGPKGAMLIDKIQRRFAQINRSYLPDYSTPEAVRKFIRRASFGDIVKPISALTLGCLAAFGTNRTGRKLTVKELSALSNVRS